MCQHVSSSTASLYSYSSLNSALNNEVAGHLCQKKVIGIFLFTKKWSRTFLTRDLFCKQSILPKNLKTAKMSFVYKTKPQISKNMTIIWHLFVRIQYNIGDHSYNSKIWIVKEHWGLKKNFTRRFFLVVVYFYSKIYKNFWEGQAYCQRYVFYQKWKKLLTATHNTSNINDFVLFLFF